MSRRTNGGSPKSWSMAYEFRKKQDKLTINGDMTVDALSGALSKDLGLNKYRIGMKYRNDNGDYVRLQGRSKTLKEYEMDKNQDAVLEVKDLGPQFSYRGVFIVEYLGPILIVLLYAMRPSFIYGNQNQQGYNWVAWWGIIAWTLHFLKREVETLFVHVFSRPTMPLFNLFKNSSYYWGFAFAVGYPLCSPSYTAPSNEKQVYLGFAIMAISEVLNLVVHLHLRSMRPKEGSTERKPPTGGLFNLASCPNYTFEVLGWVGFSIATNIALAYVFTVVGFGQMTIWAMEKHRAYCRQDKSLKKRAAIVPFIL